MSTVRWAKLRQHQELSVRASEHTTAAHYSPIHGQPTAVELVAIVQRVRGYSEHAAKWLGQRQQLSRRRWKAMHPPRDGAGRILQIDGHSNDLAGVVAECQALSARQPGFLWQNTQQRRVGRLHTRMASIATHQQYGNGGAHVTVEKDVVSHVATGA